MENSPVHSDWCGPQAQKLTDRTSGAFLGKTLTNILGFLKHIQDTETLMREEEGNGWCTNSKE
jgi:hypothetical protein